MSESGKAYILKIRRQWQISSLLSAILLALTFTVLIISLLYRITNNWIWWVLPISGLSLVLFIRLFNRKVRIEDVYRFLNNRFPQLEESSQLLIRPKSDLSLLEKIQTEKIESRITELPRIKTRGLVNRAFIFLAAVLISLVFVYLPFPPKRADPGQGKNFNQNQITNKIEVVPAKIESVNISIVPPAYTRKISRNQQKFTLLIESGSQVIWKLKTTEPVNELSFIFNDKERVRLKSANAEGTAWEFRKIITKPGFYQLKINDQRSELYPLEVIKDQPATIRIIEPKQYSTIDFGQPQKVNLKVSIADDYGIKSAVIMATTASGQGEGVQFKEQQIPFAANFNTQNRNYNLQKTIDLKVLSMVPGDELYFYVKAWDNFNQESRSETYFVSIADTSELMSMEGMASGVDLVPEYFRSMRQIIIDTEKLIKERPSTNAEDFKNRSNNLGIDQKMLRLRYGKFLGEEGGEEDHDEHATDQPAAFGNTDAILNEFGHNHDNAEDATFFEPELKSQLKATLTEMWNSELRLRTYKPAEALPYEYKALRLLKDLQQKSRVYVAKTSSKTPTLKPETRLSGELDKIINPFNQRKLAENQEPFAALKQTPEILNKLKIGIKLSPDDWQVLVNANKILSEKAAANPSDYLGAVIALRKIINSENSRSNPLDLVSIAKALQNAIPKTSKLPQASQSGVSTDLSSQYFKNLNRLQQ